MRFPAAGHRSSRRRRAARAKQESGGAVTLTASSYPFLNILWTTLIFFAWVIFIWIAITVLIDVFRRHDMSGWAKAAWVVLVVLFPWLGVLIYLIVNHAGMAERRYKEAATQQAQFDDYVRTTAGSGGGAAAEIEKAKKLLDAGTITQAEFDAIKTKALA
jgi:phospholipase D-like protein/putative oligomerization/nucleic acid binding protein